MSPTIAKTNNKMPKISQVHPDKLILNKRDLTHLPLLEGEEKLKLLYLQGNQIAKIENSITEIYTSIFCIK